MKANKDTAKYIGIIGFFLIVLALSFLPSCAIVGAGPTGGAKDTTAPKMVLAQPENKTVHFNADKIVLNFDEFIDLDNPQREIIITPTLPKSPEITANKKRLTVNFKGMALQPNTTYSIQFGKSIKDINEGNIREGYRYVFSTGDYIDSFYLKGRALNALTAKPAAKLKVMLYQTENDTGLFRGKPLYYSVGEGSGDFSLNYLPKGKFKLIAIEDKNDNYVLDDDEDVAFLNEPVTMDSSVEMKKTLLLSPYHNPYFAIKSLEASSAQIKIKLNRSADSLKLFVNGSAKDTSVFHWTSPSMDSILYWPGKQGLKFETARFMAWSGAQHIDTLLNKITLDNKKDNALNADPESNATYANKYSTPFVVKFNRPLASVDLSKISFFKDSAKALKFASVKFLDSSHTLLGFYYNYDEEAIYTVTIKPGAFTAVSGLKTKDSVGIAVHPPARKDFGYLEVKVSPPDPGNYIFQLTKEDGSIVFEKGITKSESIIIPYLISGNYGMRLIADRNQNGRWDAGDVRTGRQPETVYQFGGNLQIKANWELTDTKFTVTKSPQEP
jgi:hypothetical protein